MLLISVPLVEDAFIDVVVSFGDVRIPCKALVDTGSTSSALKYSLIEKLDTPFLEQEQIYTANGIKMSSIHEASIQVVFDDNRAVGDVSRVSILETNDQRFDVLLGMDVLKCFNSVCIQQGKELVITANEL